MWQKIKNYYHLTKSCLASIYYGFPSQKLDVIGITGTDGKTTTASMLYKILKDNRAQVSIITSVNAQIGTQTFETGFHVTTPSPWQVQRFLRKAVNSRSKYFILETTSHRLDQNIVANIDFAVGIITNITHEHLDYHKSWHNYAGAKAKLFKKSKVSVLNKDDSSFEVLKKVSKDKIVTYSLKGSADVTQVNYKLKLKVPGEFNMYNALAASAAAQSLGIGKRQIIKSLNSFVGVKGRMEEVSAGQNFRAIVDFAHTPNGLKQALSALKNGKGNGHLIAVFGSAGLRDRAKRMQMGEIAASIADISVLTAEDPRTEKVSKIIAEIAQGFKKLGKIENKDYFIVEDRGEAINYAVKLAKKGDTVACFGKSHEKSMAYGKKEYPWDEFEAVKKSLKEKMKVSDG
ncbi:UDP-N-acetylmuramoyl-L-alanyl-D-glutamate--2,6-diaminopimelate ligase [Candidatus Curtissbacteria bacterium]|nr:UDP-N-acetylmuramoyl-L-alanyl-D-glutamate--2,6-diaminopimelate ligase [Candidatus Curtissbacteria bacterium]